ncbi:unnamed protein product, partial [Closterium sp. NIES-54]
AWRNPHSLRRDGGCSDSVSGSNCNGGNKGRGSRRSGGSSNRSSRSKSSSSSISSGSCSSSSGSSSSCSGSESRGISTGKASFISTPHSGTISLVSGTRRSICAVASPSDSLQDESGPVTSILHVRESPRSQRRTDTSSPQRTRALETVVRYSHGEKPSLLMDDQVLQNLPLQSLRTRHTPYKGSNGGERDCSGSSIKARGRGRGRGRPGRVRVWESERGRERGRGEVTQADRQEESWVRAGRSGEGGRRGEEEADERGARARAAALQKWLEEGYALLYGSHGPPDAHSAPDVYGATDAHSPLYDHGASDVYATRDGVGGSDYANVVYSEKSGTSTGKSMAEAANPASTGLSQADPSAPAHSAEPAGTESAPRGAEQLSAPKGASFLQVPFLEVEKIPEGQRSAVASAVAREMWTAGAAHIVAEICRQVTPSPLAAELGRSVLPWTAHDDSWLFPAAPASSSAKGDARAGSRRSSSSSSAGDSGTPFTRAPARDAATAAAAAAAGAGAGGLSMGRMRMRRRSTSLEAGVREAAASGRHATESGRYASASGRHATESGRHATESGRHAVAEGGRQRRGGASTQRWSDGETEREMDMEEWRVGGAGRDDEREAWREAWREAGREARREARGEAKSEAGKDAGGGEEQEGGSEEWGAEKKGRSKRGGRKKQRSASEGRVGMEHARAAMGETGAAWERESAGFGGRLSQEEAEAYSRVMKAVVQLNAHQRRVVTSSSGTGGSSSSSNSTDSSKSVGRQNSNSGHASPLEKPGLQAAINADMHGVPSDHSDQATANDNNHFRDLVHLAAQAPLAQQRLVAAHSGLVRSIARRFFGHGVSLSDLYHAGVTALLRAAATYNPSFASTASDLSTHQPSATKTTHSRARGEEKEEKVDKGDKGEKRDKKEKEGRVKAWQEDEYGMRKGRLWALPGLRRRAGVEIGRDEAERGRGGVEGGRGEGDEMRGQEEGEGLGQRVCEGPADITQMAMQEEKGRAIDSNEEQQQQAMSFSSWASRLVYQTLQQEVWRRSPVFSFPRYAYFQYAEISAAYSSFRKQHAREPTLADLSAATSLSPQRIVTVSRAMRRVKNPLSFDVSSLPNRTHTETFSNDKTDPWQHLLDSEHLFLLSHALSSLDPHRRLILELRFGLRGSRQVSQEEIAAALGMTVKMVSYLE